MAWDTPRVDGDIHYAADHNTEIDEIKSKALLVGGTLDGNLMSGSTPVLFDVAFPRNATPAVGSIFWEADNETATIQLHADCDLPIGLRELRRVYNPTGSTMLKGSAVYTNGVGGTPTVVAVALAQANAAATSLVLGILSDDIGATHTGFCTVRGHVYIDTSAFDGAAGDSLYLSETVAGGLTSTPPISPNFSIRMGRLIIKDATDGKINVRLTTQYSLGTLTDVSVPSPIANQILKFNGVSWVAADTTTVSSAGGTDFYLTGNHANPIEALSRAASCEVTWTGHGQSTGASCAFWGITQAGWTALNSTAAVPIWYKITVTSVDAFTIAVNTSGYAAPYNPAVDNGTISIGILQNSPDTAITTQTDSADAGSSTGEVLMTTFQTPLPLGRTVLTGGEWVFKTWCYASSATDVNTVVIRVYKRDTAGTETQLFYTETADLGVVNTLSQITIIQGSHVILATDHLVVKYFAKSDREKAGVRRLYLTHNGTDKYSFVKTPLSLSHASLDFLQYSNAGHVGFAPSNPLATDTLWDAAGDMVIGTGPNTAHKLAAGAATTILKGGGAADPVWTTVTGSGAPVCAVSPALTSVPTAPTAAIDTNSTQIATTEFVQVQRKEQPTGVALADAPVKGGVFNGGFELAPTFVAVQTANNYIDGTAAGSATIDQYGWYGVANVTAVAMSFDSTVSHSGKYSLKYATTDATGKGYCYRGLNVTIDALSKYCPLLKASTKYRISAWIKTNNVAADAVYFSLYQFDIAAVAGTVITSTKIGGTTDWTCYVSEFTSDSDAGGSYGRILLFNFVAGNIGQAWFDDITLEEVVEDTTFTGTIPTPVRPTIVGVTTTDNIDQSLDSRWAAVQHYNLPTSVSETATELQTFTPTRNKVTNIAVKVVAKGTGNWTLLIHDAANAVLASQQILIAALADNTVTTFNVPCLWTTGALHFHLISSVNDGTVLTTTVHDLETCSFIQYYAKPTENATIVCNGEKISLSTNEDGLLSGAIIDLDKGKYTYNGATSTTDVGKISDVYSASAGGSTILPLGINGWQIFIGIDPYLDFSCGSDATVRYLIYKVNTIIPIKHLKMKVGMFSNSTNSKLFQISSDGTNWVTLWDLNLNLGGRASIIVETDFANGLSTFYIRFYKGANEPTACGIVYIEADLDTASVPSLILQPLATPVQYSDNIYIPATADRVYLQNAKYANDRGVVVPHLEFCATAVPIVAFPLKVDNTGEANPAVRIMTALSSGSPTIGTGTDDGSGNWILNTGEYIGITGTANTAIKLTYQIGTGTTAFSNLTMNRLYLSSNGVANSATKDPSYQFNFYLGMLKEGVQKVVESVQRAVNDLSIAAQEYFDKDGSKALTGVSGTQICRENDTGYLTLRGGTRDTPCAALNFYGKDNGGVNAGGQFQLYTNDNLGNWRGILFITGGLAAPIISWSNLKLSDVADPLSAQDAATKNYVDTKMAAVYPIGSIYISVVSTNPNTLFGFGTWAAFGTGQVLVGIDTGDTKFDVVKESGGNQAVSSSAQTMAGIAISAHAAKNTDAGADSVLHPSGSTGTHVAAATHLHNITEYTHTVSNQGTLTPGAATSVIQPYIVVYMWERTA